MIILSSAKIKHSIQEELIKAYPEINFLFYTSMDEAKGHLSEADILLTYGEDLTPEIIGNASSLKWINVISAGMDRMPFESIDEKGILVTNARGIHKGPMAEYTVAMMLQISRNAKQLIANEQMGKWDRTVSMSEISGKTIGILGVGAIGAEIARLAKAFNMYVVGMNRSGNPVNNVDEIYQEDRINRVIMQSDFLVSVLPSTNETYHFLREEHFKAMKPTSVFINIGRGSTVFEEDLIRALEQGYIQHAVLDVMDQEPLPEDHPFWKMENVTVTPHLSGISPHYQARAITLFKENLTVYLKNGSNYINKIDLKRGY